MNPDRWVQISRYARLIPALVVRDALFRYAAIAACAALMFLIARCVGDFGKQPHVFSGSVLTPGAREAGRSTPNSDPSVQILAPIAITPSRTLNGIAVDPATDDSFGKAPKGAKSP